MANTIKIKRGSGSDPAASDMVLGEPVLRTDTAELFFKKDDGSVAKVSGGGGGPDFKYLELRNAANNGAASYPNADFTLVTSGTTTAIIPAAANTLLVSVNGVIQKPNTGTSTPSSGFALSGSTIKFGANISSAPDFILYQESGGIGEPSDETVSEAKLKVSNNPVNGYFLSAQSGNTGGLTWAAPIATSCTGNSATATALATARAINGVNFDGTAAITVTAAAGTLTGTTLKSTVVTSSLTSLGDLTSLTVTGDVVIADSIIHSGDTNTKIRFPAADTVSVETAGTERLRIDSSGNLTIGNDGDSGSGPSAGYDELCIEGGNEDIGMCFISPAANNVKQRITFGDSNNNKSGEIRYDHANDDFEFYTAGAERMRITSAGNVEIDSFNSPSTRTLSLRTGYAANANGGTGIAAKDHSGAAADGLGIYGTDGVSIHTANAGTVFERMRIDSGGNVGIGTTSAVNNSGYGGITLNGGSGAIFSFKDSDVEKTRLALVLDTTFSIQYPPSGILRFDSLTADGSGNITGATERMRIDSSGKVGINTTDIESDLHVCTSGSSEQDGTLRVGGSDSSLGLTFSYDQSSHTTSKIYANPTYTNTGSLLHIGVDGDANPNQLVLKGEGRVGIGTSSPDRLFHVADLGTNGAIMRLTNEGGTSLPDGTIIGMIEFESKDNSDAGVCGSIRSELTNTTTGACSLMFQTGVPSTLGTGMNFNHNGNLIIGQTTDAGARRLEVYGGSNRAGFFFMDSDSVPTIEVVNQSNATGCIYMEFNRGTNNPKNGSITKTSGASVNYNTSSDYRLKENVVSLTGAITRLKTLLPKRFNWIEDESNTLVDGFLAHEVTAVPEAVVGTKDQVDADNNPVYQQIDQSKLVPLLVAALQEAIGRIEALEAK